MERSQTVNKVFIVQLKPCLHVTFSSQLLFNIVSMLTGLITGRMGCEPFLSTIH